jgi:Family of unknown function (DUF5343)
MVVTREVAAPIWCAALIYSEVPLLIDRYMTSVKNVPEILTRIREGTAPDKFTVAHLKGLGFKSSNDQGFIPLLKALGFLAEDGKPTKRYHDYRDRTRSKLVLAEALRDAYGDLFHIKEKLTENDRSAIEGKFKSTHNVSERVAKLQGYTFLALLKEADINSVVAPPASEASPLEAPMPEPPEKVTVEHAHLGGLHYNIQIHLPATKDIEVFNAIFKALKEHLFV